MKLVNGTPVVLDDTYKPVSSNSFVAYKLPDGYRLLLWKESLTFRMDKKPDERDLVK